MKGVAEEDTDRNRERHCRIEDMRDIATCHSLDEGKCEVVTIPSQGRDPSPSRALCVRNDVSLPHRPFHRIARVNVNNASHHSRRVKTKLTPRNY